MTAGASSSKEKGEGGHDICRFSRPGPWGFGKVPRRICCRVCGPHGLGTCGFAQSGRLLGFVVSFRVLSVCWVEPGTAEGYHYETNFVLLGVSSTSCNVREYPIQKKHIKKNKKDNQEFC